MLQVTLSFTVKSSFPVVSMTFNFNFLPFARLGYWRVLIFHTLFKYNYLGKIEKIAEDMEFWFAIKSVFHVVSVPIVFLFHLPNHFNYLALRITKRSSVIWSLSYYIYSLIYTQVSLSKLLTRFIGDFNVPAFLNYDLKIQANIDIVSFMADYKLKSLFICLYLFFENVVIDCIASCR